MAKRPVDGQGRWPKKLKTGPYKVKRKGVEHILDTDLEIQLFASLMVMDVTDFLYEVAHADV